MQITQSNAAVSSTEDDDGRAMEAIKAILTMLNKQRRHDQSRCGVALQPEIAIMTRELVWRSGCS